MPDRCEWVESARFGQIVEKQARRFTRYEDGVAHSQSCRRELPGVVNIYGKLGHERTEGLHHVEQLDATLASRLDFQHAEQPLEKL